jgi:hypothetical protein
MSFPQSWFVLFSFVTVVILQCAVPSPINGHLPIGAVMNRAVVNVVPWLCT